MEFIFSGVFILLILAFSAASLFLTQKVVDLFKIEATLFKYIAASISSGLVVFGSKVLGSTVIASILAMLGYIDLPPPDVSVDSWFVYLLIWLASFLISGGIFDWRKFIQRE